MEVIARSLQEAGTGYALIDPVVLLGEEGVKGDVADLVEDEVDLIGSLSQFSVQTQNRVRPSSMGSPEDFIARLKVLSTGQFVYPGTARIAPAAVIGSAWYAEGNGVPKDPLVKHLRTLLEHKARNNPTDLAFRVWRSERDFYYRVDDKSKLVHVNGQVELQADCPEGIFVSIPESPSRGHKSTLPSDVDLNGSWQDFLEIGRMYHLGEDDLRLMECSLCCTFLGLQTPIWILEGAAGSGKTSLARTMIGVVEPTVPSMDADLDISGEMRSLINLLKKSEALMIDNVSRISKKTSDFLCKLVTGWTLSLIHI